MINQQMRPLEFGKNVWYNNSEDVQHNLASRVGWRLTWEDSETHWKDLDDIDDIDDLDDLDEWMEMGGFMHFIHNLLPYLSVLMEMPNDGHAQINITATVSNDSSTVSNDSVTVSNDSATVSNHSAKNLSSEGRNSNPRSRLGFVPAFNLQFHRTVSFCRVTFDVEFIFPPEVNNFTPQILVYYDTTETEENLFRAKMTKIESGKRSGSSEINDDDNKKIIYHVEFINHDFGAATHGFFFLTKYFITYQPVCEENQIHEQHSCGYNLIIQK